MRDKKKFKDTVVGKFLLKKLPGMVSGILTDKGVLCVLKNLIDSDDETTIEEKEQMHRELRELYELEVADRDSARSREVEIAKTNKTDIMMLATGLTGLFSFIFMVYAVVYIPSVMENDLFVHLMGMIEGVVVSNIFAYYYGTSAKDR
jgi:hypothetical protein